jgi:hypothetical protein
MYRHQEPIPAPRQRLDELRGVGRVAERLPDLSNAEIEALLEIHERVAAPHVLMDGGARHDLSGMPGQQFQDFERLRRQLDELALVPELAGRGIELEGPEAKDGRTAHRKLIHNSFRINGRAQARSAL